MDQILNVKKDTFSQIWYVLSGIGNQIISCIKYQAIILK